MAFIRSGRWRSGIEQRDAISGHKIDPTEKIYSSSINWSEGSA